MKKRNLESVSCWLLFRSLPDCAAENPYKWDDATLMLGWLRVDSKTSCMGTHSQRREDSLSVNETSVCVCVSEEELEPNMCRISMSSDYACKLLKN